MMNNRMNRKGFTLIELMIVVVIIGILAALAIPRFMQATTKTKQSEAKLILKQIYVNQRTYFQGAVPSAYYQPGGSASAASPFAFSTIYIEIMPGALYSFAIVSTPPTFTATATANLDDDATIDTWTVDQTGTITNTINDVLS